MVWSTGNDSKKCLKKCFALYKCVLMLNNFGNICISDIALPIWELTWTASLSTGFFWFRLNVNVSPLELGLMLIITFLRWSAPLHYFSGNEHTPQYRPSTALKSHLVALSKTREHEEESRILRSLPVVRCHVGKFYEMEGGARLNIIDAVIQVVVFLLLTF